MKSQNIFVKRKKFNIGNRSLAIKKAIQNAEPGDVMLIAGKGHEKKQIYKNKILNISDKEIVNKLKIKLKKLKDIDQIYLQNKTILREILKIRNLLILVVFRSIAEH